MEITIGMTLTVLLVGIVVTFLSYLARDLVAFGTSAISFAFILFGDFVRNSQMIASALIMLAIIVLVFNRFPDD